MKRILRIPVACITCLIFIIVCIIAYAKFSNYSSYKTNAHIVKRYMRENYGNVNYELKKTIVGKNAWPTDRTNDEFIYFDNDNNFYFIVTASSDNITDNYNEAFGGQKLTLEIKEKFKLNDNYLIRGWDESEDGSYDNVYFQVIIFTDKKDINENSFKIYQYLMEKCQNVSIDFVFASQNSRNKYNELFEYESRIALVELPHYFFCEIKTDDKFADYNEFSKFIKAYKK